MRVGFVHDALPTTEPSGTAHALEEFGAQRPDGVEIAWCLPDQLDRTCDLYVVAGMARQTAADMNWLLRESQAMKVRLIPAWDDGMPADAVAATHASMSKILFRSPYHQEIYEGMYGVSNRTGIIPTPVSISDVRRATDGIPRTEDIVHIARHSVAKGHDISLRWARDNRAFLHLYGPGVPIDRTDFAQYFGPLPRRVDVWQAMARYERFIYAPRCPEPFGATIVEAWLAGCDLVLTQQAGVLSFGLDPDGLAAICDTAPQAFWGEVLNA